MPTASTPASCSGTTRLSRIEQGRRFEGAVDWDTSKPDGQPRRCLDTTRAERRLDWEATTDLQTGLERTVEWYLSEGRDA